MSKQIDLIDILVELKAIEKLFKQNVYLGGLLAKIESSAANDYIIGPINGKTLLWEAICKIAVNLHKTQEMAMNHESISDLYGFQKEEAIANAFEIPIDEPLDRIMDMLAENDNAMFNQLVDDCESDFDIIGLFIATKYDVEEIKNPFLDNRTHDNSFD